jgi:hypothetical protein
MGLGWRVILQKALPEPELPAAPARAVLFAQNQLEAITEQLELPPLTSFVSADPDHVADYLLQHDLNPEDFPIPGEAWFAPADGLKTVRALLAHLKTEPAAVADPVRVVQELRVIEMMLVKAEQDQVAFHLTSDLPDPDAET